MLEIRLLGPLHLTWQGHELPRPSRSDVRQLLAYLVLERASWLSRRTISGALWPETAETVAYARLRRTLHRLGSALPEGGRDDWVGRQEGALRWQPRQPHRLDLDEFERLDSRCTSLEATDDLNVLRRDLDRALELAAGPLLAGDDAEWLTSARDRYSARKTRLLEQHVEVCQALGDLPAAVASTEALIDREPLHEPAHRHLMALLCKQGDPEGACRVYERYGVALQAEVSAGPRLETTELYESIRAGAVACADVTRRLSRLPEAERLDLIAMSALGECFSLDDGLAASQARGSKAQAKARLLNLIDRGLVVACCGTGVEMHYRVPEPVRAALETRT